ncbi:response regulator transcription factor [Deinococcus maricopensis]|uniref:Two component transcriptional regulator, winged helix family n=1 Tax=Deinococcus maricopensis (strain DSM 21211 / LMG 22137 / NRRL B-23946 / LB-34) TaxID=709986 RepID=E8U7V3_DEIML|nr:response regulator transcription factor [Deinococcus maricopensis]ADV67142.1 two component transcriptional regulator, winged helix family [Deinococcus maricopensis DSM 21211]
MRLLLVEDDARLARPIIDTLTEAGYDVTWRADGDAGLHEALLGAYPLIILDVMLPHRDGFSVAHALRDAGSDAGLLFLTARGELPDRVQGLDVGGDAYLVKPFETPELLATLRALARRDARGRAATLTFAAGRGRLDQRARTVTWDGAEASVTAREYALLETLALAPGRWFTREALVDRIWGAEFGGEARIVDVYVRYLRRKLAPEAIASERGRGYRVDA